MQLVPAAGEELDAVVGHRVVRGRQHDAEVGAPCCGEQGDGRGRQHADAHDVDAGAGQARDDGGLEELPRGARVASDDRERTMAGEHAALGQHVRGRHRQVERELGRQVAVGQATDAVGAEQAHAAAATASAGAISACCTAEPCGPS